MMALCSHCRPGLSVEPSAMSPTLQLSTFIKRLQTPPLIHWQDLGFGSTQGLPFRPKIILGDMCLIVALVIYVPF